MASELAKINDPSYGNQMVVDGFFSSPDIPDERIGGWYVQGHDAKDAYQDFVIIGADCGDWLSQVEGWIDCFRSPIEIGSPLLNGK